MNIYIGRTAPSWPLRWSLKLVSLFVALTASLGRAQAPSVSDPALVQRLATLMATNPELVARRAMIEAARARYGIAGAAPVASLEMEIEEVPRVADVTGATVQVGVSREIVSSAVRSARRAVARSDIRRAELRLQLSERALSTKIDQLLTRAASGAAVGRRLAAEDSLLVSAEDALRSRFAIGEARYVDVLRLRTERLRVRSEQASVMSEARIARRALISLVSTGSGAVSATSAAARVDEAIALAARAALLEALPPGPSIDSLVAISGAVRNAAEDVAEAESARRLLHSEQRSTIVASAGAQRFGREGGGHALGLTLGASVSLPFTARRAIAASRVAADRDVTAAEATREAIAADARADIGAAIERYEAARAQVALFDTAVLRAAREEREAALAAYRAGDLTLVELLDFERALARAEVDRLRSRMDAADALADLATGVAMNAVHDLPSRATRSDR